MRAFVLTGYGSPDRLRLTDLDRPEPGPGEVLVRVRATSVNPYDWHHLRGEPMVARLMGGTIGPRRPKLEILGADLAGEVVVPGPGATAFAAGDEVFALLEGGAFAEYVCVPEAALVPKPANLSFAQAAAVPVAGCTAMLAVRERGRVGAGQKVLVNGASGGVGSFALQIAVALGAEVTGVCGPRNVDLVRSLGAKPVIDYTATDFTRTGQRHDVLIDIAGTRAALACRRALTRTGIHVLVGGPAGRWLQPVRHVAGALALGPVLPGTTVLADLISYGNFPALLRRLVRLLEDGAVTPVIDRTYAFEEIPAAVSYQEAGHAPGKVIIEM